MLEHLWYVKRKIERMLPKFIRQRGVPQLFRQVGIERRDYIKLLTLEGVCRASGSLGSASLQRIQTGDRVARQPHPSTSLAPLP
jgi:hypothetical protein